MDKIQNINSSTNLCIEEWVSMEDLKKKITNQIQFYNGVCFKVLLKIFELHMIFLIWDVLTIMKKKKTLRTNF